MLTSLMKLNTIILIIYDLLRSAATGAENIQRSRVRMYRLGLQTKLKINKQEKQVNIGENIQGKT